MAVDAPTDLPTRPPLLRQSTTKKLRDVVRAARRRVRHLRGAFLQESLFRLCGGVAHPAGKEKEADRVPVRNFLNTIAPVAKGTLTERAAFMFLLYDDGDLSAVDEGTESTGGFRLGASPTSSFVSSVGMVSPAVGDSSLIEHRHGTLMRGGSVPVSTTLVRYLGGEKSKVQVCHPTTDAVVMEQQTSQLLAHS